MTRGNLDPRDRAGEADYSEEKHRLLLDALPVPITINAGPQRRRVYANDSFLALIGAPDFASIEGESADERVYDADRDRSARNVDEIFERHQLRADTHYRLWSFDRQRLVEVDIHGIPVVFGGEPAVLGTFVDRTAVTRAEEERADAEERYRALVEMSPMGICIHSNGVFTYANAALGRMVGADPETIVGRPVECFIAPEELEIVRARVKAEYEHGEPTIGMRHQWVRDDGSRFFVDVTTAPLELDGRQVVQAVVNDRSASDAMQQAVVEAAVELEQVNAVQSAIFAAMPEGFSLLDANGVHLSVNPALCAMTGFSEAELLGAGPPHPYWPPDEYEAIGRAFEATMRGDTSEFEFDFMRKNGERFPVLISPAVIRDSGGAMISAFSVVRDMTERKRAEHSLALETQRLQAHIDNSPLATVEFDASAHITRWSDSATRMFGWTTQEVIGKAVIGDFKWVHEDDVESVRRLSGSMVAGTVPWSINENRNYRKDGSIIDCVWYNSVLMDGSGRVESLMSRVLDVTDRTAAEQALRDSEERYRSVVSTIHEGVILQAADGTVLTCNRSAAEVFHVGEEEVRGHTSASRDWGVLDEHGAPLAGEDHPSMVTLRTGKACENVTLGVREGEDIRWIDVNTEPIFGPGSSKPAAVVISFTDVTERRETERQLADYKDHLETLVGERTAELEAANTALEEASKAKNLFLASMSHELRTPLNSIIGFTGIMLQGMTGELTSEQRAQLEMVNRAGRQLLGLVSDVLDLERIAAGRVELDLEDVDVARLIGIISDTVRPMAEDVGLTLDVDLTRAPQALFTDRLKLEQILLNFLSNAVKYTERGGITLAVAQTPEGQVAFSVRDTGIGIDAEDQVEVFEEFRQLPARSTAKHPGSGLGLAISRQLADLIGGRIELESAPGAGSTFTLVLPAATPEMTPPEAD